MRNSYLAIFAILIAYLLAAAKVPADAGILASYVQIAAVLGLAGVIAISWIVGLSCSFLASWWFGLFVLVVYPFAPVFGLACIVKRRNIPREIVEAWRG